MTKSTQHGLPYNCLRSMRTFWHVARFELISNLVLAAGQVAANLLQIWLLGKVINELSGIVLQQQPVTNQLYLYAGLMVGMTLVEQLCWALMGYVEKQGYQKWSGYNYMVFNERASLLDLQQFDNPDMRSRINRLQQEGYAWKPVNFAFTVLYLVHSFMRMASTLVILASLMPVLIPVLLLGSIPAMMAEKREADVSWGIWHVKAKDSNLYWRLAGLLQDKHSALEIRSLGARRMIVDKADQAMTRYIETQRAVMRRFLRFSLIGKLTEGLALGGVSVWLISKVIESKGAFTIGQFSAYSGYAMQFQSSSGMVYKNIVQLLDGNKFMTELYGFLDECPVITDKTSAQPIQKARMPVIEFKDVSFSYPGQDTPVFAHLNLRIEPGAHVAIVGRNGAGKTTLIKLLMRYYDVTDGAILLDGIDIRDIAIESWRDRIGVLFQEYNRYPFDFDDNIKVGRHNASLSKKRLNESLEQSNAGVIRDKLPEKGKTMLDPTFEGGVDLSGGQWQKIALARAFYRDADLLVLDEPTAAVDAKAEYQIFERIRKTSSDKTTLIVSHRFSTVRQAKRIIVLDEGKIIEDGSHAELMDKQGLYHEMFMLQAEGYR